MNAYLIIGCHGRKVYGFTMCESVSNILLDLKSVPDSREDIYSILDKHYKIFDVILTDQNKIGNLISFLHSNKIIPNHIQQTLYDFIALHRKCGLFVYIKIDLEEVSK